MQYGTDASDHDIIDNDLLLGRMRDTTSNKMLSDDYADKLETARIEFIDNTLAGGTKFDTSSMVLKG